MIEYRDERLQIMLSPEELAVIDAFQFQHRIPTRAAAVRELLKLGLASSDSPAGFSMKFSTNGVLRRGPDGPQAAES
jgi:hypothetical protein